MSTPEEPPPNIPAGEPSTSAPAAADAVADDADERVRLAKANEAAWLQVAALAEEVNDPQKASDAYEHVLKHNDRNVHALLQLASISRLQERFSDAVNYLQKVLEIDGSSGEVHGAIGHCYLTLSQRAVGVPAILDCLRNCYDAYYEASLHLGAFHDPNLWYGIGLLYERYGALMPAGPMQSQCYQAASEALRSVLQAAPHFEKRAEILYRCAHE
jgi:glucose repression mediator protein